VTHPRREIDRAPVHTIDLRDPTLSSDARHRLCWQYYDQAYRAAFPVLDEAEDPPVWLPLLGSTPPPPAALITYLCVRADLRGRGIGSLLLRLAIETLEREAGRVIPIFAETEDPAKLIDPGSIETARERLNILVRLGFRQLAINYRQPALGPTKKPVDHLKFLVRARDATTAIRQATLRTFMGEFYAALDAGEPDEAHIFGTPEREFVATIGLAERT
jgi:GNAT superfamily N-acetyltransferase